LNARQVIGLSRDTVYHFKQVEEYGGISNSCYTRIGRQPNSMNHVDEQIESAVLKYATDFPAYGHVRATNELHKLGVFVSPSGV
jgi:hypothetical protein